MLIEQKLMRAVKSSGGLAGARFRKQSSAHKLWTATVDQMSSIAQAMSMRTSNTSTSGRVKKAAVHIDLTPSARNKDLNGYTKALN